MGKFKEQYFGNSVYLDEGAVDWVFTYQLLKRVALPFNKWPAYANGLIDDKGQLLRDPTTEDRKEYWGYFDRIVWNIKKIITKFTGHSQLSAAIVSTYLLKEGVGEEKSDEMVEKIFGKEILIESSTISISEINANYNIIKRELI